MVRLLLKLIIALLSNLIALLVAVRFVQGFEIVSGFDSFFLVAGILTFLNIFIRPLLKLILTPVIILTLGFATFLINALILFLLDKFLTNITITGTLPLIYATIIISLINIVINFLGKRLLKD